MFTQANPVKDLGPECSAVLAEYAGLLASQGRLDVASTYLKGICHVNVIILVLSCAPTHTCIKPYVWSVFIILPVSYQALIFFSSISTHFSFTLTVGVNVLENILIDRLYNAGVPAAGSRPPAFPFDKVIVTAITAVTAKPVAATSGISATGNARYVRARINSPVCTCFALFIDSICLYITRHNKLLLHISSSLTAFFFSPLLSSIPLSDPQPVNKAMVQVQELQQGPCRKDGSEWLTLHHPDLTSSTRYSWHSCLCVNLYTCTPSPAHEPHLI